jgi:hypothetical protein
MTNNKQQTEADVLELAMKLYPFSNSERNAFIDGYNKANEIDKEEIVKAFDRGRVWNMSWDGESYYEEIIIKGNNE